MGLECARKCGIRSKKDLIGIQVRRSSGEIGLVVEADLPWLTFQWFDDELDVVEEQTLLRTDSKLRNDIQVLLPGGWKYFDALLSEDVGSERVAALIEDLEDILLERSKHHPFKNCGGPLGIGPRGREGPPKRNVWVCKAKNYKVVCKGRGPYRGRVKRFSIKRDYKKGYNSDYRAFLSKGAKSSKCAKARLRRDKEKIKG